MRTLMAASRDRRLRAGLSPGGLDPRIEALLQPDQRQRLRELDLQWRGPLAVNEPSLAATLRLTSGQRERAKAALEIARKAQEKLTTAYAHYLRGYIPSSPTEPAGSGLAQPPEPPPKPDIRKPETLPRPQPTRAQLEESFNLARKEERQARRTAEENVLRSLTPEQRQTWNALLGKPFRFATEEDLTAAPTRQPSD
jgi:hypothetical protein